MNRGLLFVGGIHGAGKTTYCQRLAELVGAQHYSAGKLIANARKLDQRNKTVADVDRNQDALIRALSHLGDRRIILDGHFCLLNDDQQTSAIPLSTFEAMKPAGLAVLTVTPEDAHERLLSRDGRAPDASVLLALQTCEVAHAKAVATALALPLHSSDAEDMLTFASTVFPPKN